MSYGLIKQRQLHFNKQGNFSQIIKHKKHKIITKFASNYRNLPYLSNFQELKIKEYKKYLRLILCLTRILRN